MKRHIPDALGVAGFCLLLIGLHLRFGVAAALMVGGPLLMVGAFLAARRLAVAEFLARRGGGG